MDVIPELPTDASIKPVLEMLMASVVYAVNNGSKFGRNDGFVWMDDVYTELKKSNTVTATFDQFFVAMSYRLVDDP